MTRDAGRKIHWMAAALILTLLANDLGWPAWQDRDLYLSAKKEYELLSKTKPAAQTRSRWTKLAERFEKLPQDFPRSPYADDAHYYAAKIYQELYQHDKEERLLDLTIKNWRALLSRYPGSSLVPEIQYSLAATLEEGKGDPAEARKQYGALIGKYPKSEWAAKARSRVDGLNKKVEEEKKKDQPRPATAQSGKALLSQIRHTSSQSYTRVTMELSSEVRYETHVLKEDASKSLPPRIYVDLLSSRLAMDATQPIPVQDGLLRQVRVGQFSPDVVRVVLDMSSLSDYRAFLLPDPYRLVIDIQGKENGDRLAALDKKGDSAPLSKPKTPVVTGLRKVVLDPGHGGKDPGAVGVNGLTEKEVVLSVARKLAQRLRKELGIEVVLTRKGDSFMPLEDRTAIANAEKADLFISLHVNASPNPEARGVETYYLNNTDDEAALRLAARENGTSRKNITDVQFILSDMIQNAKLEDSITLANRLHGSVVSQVGRRYGEVRDLGVKKALFYVLVGARMPSVLVELFFVTNKSEGSALATEAYQDAIAAALLEGIKKYHESSQVVKNL